MAATGFGSVAQSAASSGLSGYSVRTFRTARRCSAPDVARATFSHSRQFRVSKLRASWKERRGRRLVASLQFGFSLPGIRLV